MECEGLEPQLDVEVVPKIEEVSWWFKWSIDIIWVIGGSNGD